MDQSSIARKTFVVFLTVPLFCVWNNAGERGYAQPTQKPLSEEESLRMKVSLTCKSDPLKAVVGKLSETSGVTLTITKDMQEAGLKVTAFIQDMPLGKIMEGLAEVFSGSWTGEGKTYSLDRAKPAGIEKELTRLGDPVWFSYVFGWAEYEKRKQLATKIYDSLTEEQREMAAHDGVPFANLPEELQKQLNEIAQGMETWEQLVRLRKAMPGLLAHALIHVRVPEKPDAATGFFTPEISISLGGNEISRIPWVLGTHSPAEGK